MRGQVRLVAAVVVAVALGAGAVAFGVALLLGDTVHLRSTAGETLRTGDYLAATINVERAVVDAETGLRGYVITREPLFLAPTRTAQAQLPQAALALERAAHNEGAFEARATALADSARAYMTNYVPRVRGGGDRGPGAAGAPPGGRRRQRRGCDGPAAGRAAAGAGRLGTGPPARPHPPRHLGARRRRANARRPGACARARRRRPGHPDRSRARGAARTRLAARGVAGSRGARGATGAPGAGASGPHRGALPPERPSRRRALAGARAPRPGRRAERGRAGRRLARGGRALERVLRDDVAIGAVRCVGTAVGTSMCPARVGGARGLADPA